METDPPDLRQIQAKAGATLDITEVFGREAAMERAWGSLSRGQNLLLDEPRRFGKTSFLELLVARARTSDWFAGKVSL